MPSRCSLLFGFSVSKFCAVLITEDASVDARFSHNPYVAGEPYIKFYAGAPLVGTGEKPVVRCGLHDCLRPSQTVLPNRHCLNFLQVA